MARCYRNANIKTDVYLNKSVKVTKTIRLREQKNYKYVIANKYEFNDDSVVIRNMEEATQEKVLIRNIIEYFTNKV